ncbi:tetratricopeptide repeat protein [Prochlorococcus sp. AH-736-N17]|nr:tetratricopeptide repeat protein [Prochlorococcus sp. AH-736-N17]MDA9728717.1 tetratricopeptide repeat protein [Prochlorococcus sp. AH-736-N17]
MKGFGDNKKTKKKKVNELNIQEIHNQIMDKAFRYHAQGNISEAKKFYQYLIDKGLKDERVFNNLGIILLNQGNLKKAKLCFTKVIEINPKDEAAYSNLGGILKEMSELEGAELCLRAAIKINPKNGVYYCNLGGILKDLGKLKEAELSVRKAIALNPNNVYANFDLGEILKDLGKLKEAALSTSKAIELNSNFPEAYYLLGSIYEDLGKFYDAIKLYQKAIGLKNDFSVAKSQLIKCKGDICDWNNMENEKKWLENIGIKGPAINPLGLLYYQDDPMKQLKRAKNLFEKKFTRKSILISPKKNKKIRIGYFSSDFRAHPVMYLISSILMLHDKSKFEIYLYSFVPKEDEYTQIAKTSGCIFKDIKNLNDVEVVQLIRKDNIDIAIDLMGYTKNHRINIFSYRVAPLQLGYLGYPGTTGSKNIDYIIADNILIPKEHEKFYSEKIIRMPNCFQCNDNKKEISKEIISRAQFNLPEKGFVFTCFCANKKITFNEFDIWMKLLKNVKGSVLWLYKSNKYSAENLIKEAIKRNVDPKSIIFATKLPFLKDHLARYTLGDLGLDTFNYNGHATTSDALWAGLPVLTKMGESYSARVSASLLNTLGLKDLITHSIKEYEEKALFLANNPDKLKSLKSQLAKSLKTSSLYDSVLFTKQLEDKYLELCLK